MSRNIKPKISSPLSEEERKLRDIRSGKLLLTTYRGQSCILLLEGDRITVASFLSETDSRLGAIYIGKVKNMVKNINACFVEIAEKEICFLPLNKAKTPCLLNREYDGRILEGDELLVQIEQEAQKTKQATVTAHISIDNDYYVLSLGNTRLLFSKNLPPKKRQMIIKMFEEKGLCQNGSLNQDVPIPREFMEDTPGIPDQGTLPHAPFMPPISVVARTKMENLDSESEILPPFFSLYAELYRLIYTAKSRSCFSCIKKAPGNMEAALNTLTSYLDTHCQEIITDQPAQFAWLKDYCANHMPSKQIRLYQDARLPLKMVYSLDTRLDVALNSHVWLKSGAYLIIEPTEAMTVIDVNSGKCECKGKAVNAEEIYFKINMEAAEEIAIQLRLRNLSGIIIVDFINMSLENHKNEVLEHMRNLVKSDKIKTFVIDMTPLGLVEITRQKVNKPLHEQIRHFANKKTDTDMQIR